MIFYSNIRSSFGRGIPQLSTMDVVKSFECAEQNFINEIISIDQRKKKLRIKVGRDLHINVDLFKCKIMLNETFFVRNKQLAENDLF